MPRRTGQIRPLVDTQGPEEIRAYQLYLTNDRKLAPSSICIAVSALRFLYTVTLKTVWPVGAVIPGVHGTSGSPPGR